MFPISRDPPEGGTTPITLRPAANFSFQFLGIPPKGELDLYDWEEYRRRYLFPISRDPPEGGTLALGIVENGKLVMESFQFLGIPPKGEPVSGWTEGLQRPCFQFLGIPPKGEQSMYVPGYGLGNRVTVSNF
jgi:hypothetical protein